MQERQLRLAAGAEIAAEAELDTGKEAVPDVAAQILPAGDGHCRVRREQGDQRLRRKLDSRDDEHVEAAAERDRPLQRPDRALRLARADGLRDGDGRAHCKAHKHDGQHVHDLRADRDRRRAGHALVLPDDEQIRHSIERLQEIGQQIRQREADDCFQNASVCQIFFHMDTPLLISPHYKLYNHCKVKRVSRKSGKIRAECHLLFPYPGI